MEKSLILSAVCSTTSEISGDAKLNAFVSKEIKLSTTIDYNVIPLQDSRSKGRSH